MRLALDDNAAVNPIIAEGQVLDVHGEVVALAGKLDQSGTALRGIDQEIMTRELATAGFRRRLTLRDIDRTGHICTGTRRVRVRLSHANSRVDDDGIVVESLSTAADVRPPSQEPDDCGGRLATLSSAHAV